MFKLAVPLLAGTAALFAAGGAQALPLVPTAPVVDDGVENVRLVCNEWGRCWQTRGPRYHYRGYDSYNYYGPRYRHRHYGYGPGVQFNAPGVHFGIGVGPRW
jgi:hypothetical protein